MDIDKTNLFKKIKQLRIKRADYGKVNKSTRIMDNLYRFKLGMFIVKRIPIVYIGMWLNIERDARRRSYRFILNVLNFYLLVFLIYS